MVELLDGALVSNWSSDEILVMNCKLDYRSRAIRFSGFVVSGIL